MSQSGPKERAGLPLETLLDKVLFYPRFHCLKWNLTYDYDKYAKDKINELTPYELLEAISQALQPDGD